MGYMTSKRDFDREAGEWIENFDFSCYTIDFDEMQDIISDYLLAHVRDNYNFSWGNELTKEMFQTFDIESVLKEYEIN